MKNMGFKDLCLVEPKEFPSEKAMARASGASDLLDSARVVSTLGEAVADCHLVVGASARGRHIPWPVLDPRALSERIMSGDLRQKVALVFGREDRGLTNEELHRCHLHVHIPSVEAFSSLNLAAAVQVLCYELRMSYLTASRRGAEGAEEPRWGTEWDIELATSEELERLFAHMEQTLVDIDFLDPDNPRQLMPRLRRLYLRSHPDKVEVNVLRGILTATRKIMSVQKP